MNSPDAHARVLHVTSLEDVKSKLGGAPAIFLSAGVPYKRSPPHGVVADEFSRRVRQNDAYMAAAAPEETIRSAVVLLTRDILRRGMRLVFGAQPAIGAMVLSIGRDVVPEDERDQPRILIFQSGYFEGQLPGSTLDLAAWETGLLVFTPEVPADQQPNEVQRRDDSLKRMRELMVCVPNLCAGIFIGGMEGVEEEAVLFRRHNAGKPMFPLVSTGSAARLLYQKAPQDYVSLFDAVATPQQPVSYSLIAHDILERIAPDSRTAPPDASASVAEDKKMAAPFTPDSPAVIAHISMLQGIINRLANNSASCKTWCFTLVAALVTLTGTAGKPEVIAVVIVPLVIFGFLDASYLAQERAYRALFRRMVGNLHEGKYTLQDTFEANAPMESGARWRAFRSWSVAPMYLTLAVLAAIAYWSGWLKILAPAATAAL